MHYFSGKGCSESLESMHYCIGILNQKSYVAIYMDVLALIMTTFGSILTQYKVIALLIGIITCLILIRLLAKEFGICGVVAGSCVSVY